MRRNGHKQQYPAPMYYYCEGLPPPNRLPTRINLIPHAKIIQVVTLWKDLIAKDLTKGRSVKARLRQLLADPSAYQVVAMSPFSHPLCQLLVPPPKFRYVHPAITDAALYTLRVVKTGLQPPSRCDSLKFPFVNDPSFPGFENSIKHDWIAALVAILYYGLPPVRVAVSQHFCSERICWICELAFTFENLDKCREEGVGQPVQIRALAEALLRGNPMATLWEQPPHPDAANPFLSSIESSDFESVRISVSNRIRRLAFPGLPSWWKSNALGGGHRRWFSQHRRRTSGDSLSLDNSFANRTYTDYVVYPDDELRRQVEKKTDKIARSLRLKASRNRFLQEQVDTRFKLHRKCHQLLSLMYHRITKLFGSMSLLMNHDFPRLGHDELGMNLQSLFTTTVTTKLYCKNELSKVSTNELFLLQLTHEQCAPDYVPPPITESASGVRLSSSLSSSSGSSCSLVAASSRSSTDQPYGLDDINVGRFPEVQKESLSIDKLADDPALLLTKANDASGDEESTCSMNDASVTSHSCSSSSGNGDTSSLRKLLKDSLTTTTESILMRCSNCQRPHDDHRLIQTVEELPPVLTLKIKLEDNMSKVLSFWRGGGGELEVDKIAQNLIEWIHGVREDLPYPLRNCPRLSNYLWVGKDEQGEWIVESNYTKSICDCVATRCRRVHKYRLINVLFSVNHQWSKNVKKLTWSIFKRWFRKRAGMKRRDLVPDPEAFIKSLEAEELSIEAPCSEDQLISYVYVPPKADYHLSDQGWWMMFNGPISCRVQEEEVMDFSPMWKFPVSLAYAREEILYHPDIMQRLPPPIPPLPNLLDPSFAPNTQHNRRPLTFVTLSPKEIEFIHTGEFNVALDAEHVVTHTIFKAPRSVLGPHPVAALGRMSAMRATSPQDPEDMVLFIDHHIRFDEEPVDYRTEFSGLMPGDLNPRVSSQWLTSHKYLYQLVRWLVNKECKFIGHDLFNDFRVIGICVPHKLIIDTVEIYRLSPSSRFLSLKFLCWHVLGLHIQQGTHDSIEDARASLLLYRYYQQWIKEQGDVAEFKRVILSHLYSIGYQSNFKIGYQ